MEKTKEVKTESLKRINELEEPESFEIIDVEEKFDFFLDSNDCSCTQA